MFHTCAAFPTRHNEPKIIDDVAAFWLSRGWHLRQPYNNGSKGWNLSGPFQLVNVKSGIVGRHFWGYEDLMEHTNKMAEY